MITFDTKQTIALCHRIAEQVTDLETYGCSRELADQTKGFLRAHRVELMGRLSLLLDKPDVVPTPITTVAPIPSSFGQPHGGGFYAGQITQDGKTFALIVAPKEGGQAALPWKKDWQSTTSGTQSTTDGLANSNAMNDAGHPAAQFCRALRIGGHDDWYLPAKDELNVLDKNLSQRNATDSAFKEDGGQAFDEVWHWSSTEFSSYGAWIQDFWNGLQHYGHESYDFRVRAVRKVLI